VVAFGDGAPHLLADLGAAGPGGTAEVP